MFKNETVRHLMASLLVVLIGFVPFTPVAVANAQSKVRSVPVPADDQITLATVDDSTAHTPSKPTATKTASKKAVKSAKSKRVHRKVMADYLVRSGDTLNGIARKSRYPVDKYIVCNPQIKNANLIWPGWVLKRCTHARAVKHTHHSKKVQPKKKHAHHKYVKGGGSWQGLKAVSAALSQLGKPYRFGATGPDSFDCSGLMQYAWAKAGVRLPRVSTEQSNVGTRVRSSRLQSGDLLFFGSGHVGMYIGAGKFIHAKKTGTRVQVTHLTGYWLDELTSARRITVAHAAHHIRPKKHTHHHSSSKNRSYTTMSNTQLMIATEISTRDFQYASYIFNKENGADSRWCALRSNGDFRTCAEIRANPRPYSDNKSYGICQALPGSKMSSAGSDWLTNPVTQMRWCDGYAKKRYGGWLGAYSHWLRYHWW